MAGWGWRELCVLVISFAPLLTAMSQPPIEQQSWSESEQGSGGGRVGCLGDLLTAPVVK